MKKNDVQQPQPLFTPQYAVFKRRLPRKFKKLYKNMMAKRLGIKPSKLRFYYNGAFNHD